MLDTWGRISLALAAAAALAGCGPKPVDAGKPPAEQPAAQARNIRHSQLKSVESKVQQALEAQGTPAFTEVFSGAATIVKGADAILEDEPATLADADRLRYEGLVSQLKERAANLQAAAEQQQVHQARRSFSQLTASCVKCHSQFGAGETH